MVCKLEGFMKTKSTRKRIALLAFVVVALVVVGVLVIPKPKPALADVSYYIHVYVCWEPDVIFDWEPMSQWPVTFRIEQVDYDKSTGVGGTAVSIVGQLVPTWQATVRDFDLTPIDPDTWDPDNGIEGTFLSIESELPIEVGANNSYTFYVVPNHHARPEVR
jgi:hypothetical protein